MAYVPWIRPVEGDRCVHQPHGAEEHGAGEPRDSVKEWPLNLIKGGK